MKKTFHLSAVAFLMAVAVSTTASAEPAHDWSYSGPHGPAHWAEISKDFQACESGRAESPINIDHAKKAPDDMPRLQLHYAPLAIDITNTGHSVQFNASPGTDSVTLGNTAYQLVQFHFHSPGEERFVGKESVMDAHLVHRSEEGKLLVLAIQFKLGDQANPVIESMMNRIPSEKGAEMKVSGVSADLHDLIPKDLSYYTYAGSLTTPPCSEGVTWIEFKTPVTITKKQLDAMQRFYHGNQRPVQPLNEREIFEVN